MKDFGHIPKGDRRPKQPRRTNLQDAPASEPEVRPEDVIPPYVPGHEHHLEREDQLDHEQLDAELDEGIDGSFPASDPPSIVSPKRSSEHDEDSADRGRDPGGSGPKGDTA